MHFKNVLVRLIAESAKRSRLFGGEGICEVHYEIAQFLINKKHFARRGYIERKYLEAPAM